MSKWLRPLIPKRQRENKASDFYFFVFFGIRIFCIFAVQEFDFWNLFLFFLRFAVKGMGQGIR